MLSSMSTIPENFFTASSWDGEELFIKGRIWISVATVETRTSSSWHDSHNALISSISSDVYSESSRTITGRSGESGTIVTAPDRSSGFADDTFSSRAETSGTVQEDEKREETISCRSREGFFFVRGS